MYARPLFVRIQSNIDVTSTFKQKKYEFIKIGFNPCLTNDEIYFRNDIKKCFELVDVTLFKYLCSQEAKY